MPIKGFLMVPDIPGEAKAAGHEGEIEFHGYEWSTEQTRARLTGSARRRSRPDVGAVTVSKYVDSASPYLALAALQGRAFDEVVLTFHRQSAALPFDYLVITLNNCVVVSFEDYSDDHDDPDAEIHQEVGFEFEQIVYKYTVQKPDGSTGDEHEIKYDVAAGA